MKQQPLFLENPDVENANAAPQLDEKTRRVVAELMAEALVAVLRDGEVDDERH